MTSPVHHRAVINGIEMHYVEQGQGPLLVMCHGFPHTWYSWHRQIGPLAEAGWRVVVPDMRGMGQTEGPQDAEGYDCVQTAGDLAALVEHLGEEQAVFAGLDFGIFAIYDLAHLHPERVRAIIALENPHYPDRPDVTPLEEAAEWAKEHFVHIEYFREPGVADADLAAAPRRFLTGVFHALSGDFHYLDVWKHPPGTTYIDALPEAPPFPWTWLSEQEMDVIIADYERSGFTGGLNWYRAMDIRWHQRKPWRDQKTQAPFYFIGSEQDVDLEAWHGEDPLAAIHDHHADVRRIEMLPKAGHLIQLERSDDVTRLMREFLTELA
ncbi:hydrolase [Croceicoccus estronivorus]|uniref:alpha/beta fold hydrolase n=1 Tax=Croceicoccus estronivorus TaxID=1172626 RepID=UPI0008356FA6|nr:alpha/beta hydrolase [Croceicoccus estronivorus]OCC25130.1 hydrolase [Croceicoccus estronivorus]